jgi:hypothetical protein
MMEVRWRRLERAASPSRTRRPPRPRRRRRRRRVFVLAGRVDGVNRTRLLGRLAALLVGLVAVGVVGALVTLVGSLSPASALVVLILAGLLIGGVIAGIRGAGRTASPYW